MGSIWDSSVHLRLGFWLVLVLPARWGQCKYFKMFVVDDFLHYRYFNSFLVVPFLRNSISTFLFIMYWLNSFGMGWNCAKVALDVNRSTIGSV